MAVAGGYLLGRTRKGKLALGLGMWLTGRKITLDPARLPELVERLPVVSGLSDEVRDQLLKAAKDAGGKVLTAQSGRLADALTRRADALRSAEGANPLRAVRGEKDKEPEPEDSEEQEEPEEPEEEEETEEPAAEAEPEPEEEQEEERPAPRKRAARGTRAAAGAATGSATRTAKKTARKAASRTPARTSGRGTRRREGGGDG
jgi:outer membrane biosynthesis protein TonB